MYSSNRFNKKPVKNSTAIMILLSFPSVFLILFILFSITNSQKLTKVASVNGHPVYAEELLALKAGMPEMEVDADSLVEQAIRIKVQQILAKEIGIIKDTRYNAFLRNFEAQQKGYDVLQDKQEIIRDNREDREFYGNYYDYAVSDMIQKLKDHLEKGKLAVKEDEMKEYYETVKESLYKGFTAYFEEMYIIFGDDFGNEDPEKKALAKDAVRNAEKILDSGKSLSEVAAILSTDKKLQVKYDARNKYDDFLVKRLERFYPIRMAEIKRLELGKRSKTIEENGAYIIIRCTEISEVRYKDFNMVKENVRARVLEDKYSEMVDGLIKNSRVVVDWEKIERIPGL